MRISWMFGEVQRKYKICEKLLTQKGSSDIRAVTDRGIAVVGKDVAGAIQKLIEEDGNDIYTSVAVSRRSMISHKKSFPSWDGTCKYSGILIKIPSLYVIGQRICLISARAAAASCSPRI